MTKQGGPSYFSSWLSAHATQIITGLIVVVSFILVVPPLLIIVRGAVVDVDAQGWSLNLHRLSFIISQKNFIPSIIHTLAFACGSSVIALLLGGFSAFLVARTNAPFKILTHITSLMSLGTPYVLYVSAWLSVLNKSGPINSLWRAWTGSSQLLFDVYSLSGMILIEGLLWSPLAFLLLSTSFRYANPDFEEAALISGASQRHVLMRITAPLAAPAILALILLIFIRCLEAFEVPSLVGLPGKVHVLTTDVFEYINRTMPPDIDSGNAVALILLALVIILLMIYRVLTRHRGSYATLSGKNFRPRMIDLGRGRSLAGGWLCLNFLCVVIIPFAMLVWLSLSPFYAPVSWAGLQRLTLVHFEHILHSERYLALIGNTFLLSTISASVVMIFAALSSFLIVRNHKGAVLIDLLASLPLGFPGIVLAVGVMQVFLALPIGIYGSIWIIIWAFCIAYLPYGLRYCVAGMMHIHSEIEEAAIMSGAHMFDVLRRITLPLLVPSLIAGWTFIFLVSTRALSVPIILSGAGSQTIALAMFDLWGNGQSPELAALGLMWGAATGILAYFLHRITEKTGLGLRA